MWRNPYEKEIEEKEKNNYGAPPPKFKVGQEVFFYDLLKNCIKKGIIKHITNCIDGKFPNYFHVCWNYDIYVPRDEWREQEIPVEIHEETINQSRIYATFDECIQQTLTDLKYSIIRNTKRWDRKTEQIWKDFIGEHKHES